MGYSTRFQFTFHCDKDREEEIRKWMKDILFGEDFMPDEDLCKWYGWKKDMTRLSHQFPDVFILIEGEGEDHNDIWRAYVKNGKVIYKKAVIIHPVLEMSEMKELQLC